MKRFWQWYERNYLLNIGIAAGLFLFQIIHLVWLFGDVIIPRLGGSPIFGTSGFWNWALILVDYTEIPALITTSLVYINELRKRFVWKPIWYLVALNIQWVHLFWITDEFVVEAFADPIALPVWLAWIAILIDYLEVPVIVATLRKFFAAVRDRKVKDFLEHDLRD